MKRLNIVTLGVKDLKASKEFYEALFGWQLREGGGDAIAFYNMGGWLVALYPWNLLAEDITIAPEGNGFPGITLAHNVLEKEDVSLTLAQAEKLGAKIVKSAQDVFWGGHSGYFQDPNGHYWEVAFNPFTKTLDDGFLDIPKQ